MTTVVSNTKLREVENKIQNSSSLVIETVLNTKISDVKNKIPDHAKYITTQELHKLPPECFIARCKLI